MSDASRTTLLPDPVYGTYVVYETEIKYRLFVFAPIFQKSPLRYRYRVKRTLSYYIYRRAHASRAPLELDRPREVRYDTNLWAVRRVQRGPRSHAPLGSREPGAG